MNLAIMPAATMISKGIKTSVIQT